MIMMMCVVLENVTMLRTTGAHSDLIAEILSGRWRSGGVLPWTVLNCGGDSDDSVT